MQSDSPESGFLLQKKAAAILAIVLGICLFALPSHAEDQPSPEVGMPLAGARPDLDTKLGSIVVSLDFHNAGITEAFQFLTMESKRTDPDHEGVSFDIDPEAFKGAEPITLTLTNISLRDALRNICKLGNVKFKLDNSSIDIVSFRESSDDINVTSQSDSGSVVTMTHKLESIALKKVNWNRLDIAKALQYLAQKSKAVDPEKKGVNFVLAHIAPTDNVHREVTIVLDNAPLSELLPLIAQQTNLRYSIEDGAVYFKP